MIHPGDPTLGEAQEVERQGSRSTRRLLAAASLVSLALAALTLAPPQSVYQSLGPRWKLSGMSPQAVPSWFLPGSLGFVLSLLGILSVRSLRERLRRKPGFEIFVPRPRWKDGILGLLGVLALLAILPPALGSVLGRCLPAQGASVATPHRRASAGTPAPAEPAGTAILPGRAMAGWACLSGGLLLGFLILWQRPPAARAPKPSPATRALARARRRLVFGESAQDAVIACYAEMCQILEPRLPLETCALTPRELAAQFVEHGLQEPEIATLTWIFEKARYSPVPCGETDRRRALQALEKLAHYREKVPGCSP